MFLSGTKRAVKTIPQMNLIKEVRERSPRLHESGSTTARIDRSVRPGVPVVTWHGILVKLWSFIASKKLWTVMCIEIWESLDYSWVRSQILRKFAKLNNPYNQMILWTINDSKYYKLYCTVYSVYCTQCTVFTVHNVQCLLHTMYSVYCTVCSVGGQCILYSV